MDIIRKLSVESETPTNNDNVASNNDSSKEIQTTEARCSPQVTPRIRGRQAYADLMLKMLRDREKELTCLLDSHTVTNFKNRGRIQSTLRIRCYERCLAIQDSHRSKSSSAGSDLNRSPRVINLLREKYKTNSENIETGTSPSSLSSRSRVMDKDPQKATEKKIVQETVEKSDLKKTQDVIPVVEIVKKAVVSESAENKSGLKKAAGETIQKEGSGHKRDTKEKAMAKENEKVNLWNSEEKLNWRKANTEKNVVLEEAPSRKEQKDCVSVEPKSKEIDINPQKVTAQAEEKVLQETSATTESRDNKNLWKSEEKLNRRKGMEDSVSVKPKSKEIENRNSNLQQAEEKVLKETLAKSDSTETKDNKNGLKKESKEEKGERREMEESVEENTSMGIAEKVNLWNSKEKKNRKRAVEKGKDKTEEKTNEVLQEASRRIINVETAERRITTSKETVEKEVRNREKKDITESCSRETTEEKGRRKKEEDFASVEAKSKDMIPQESMSHGYKERAKEKNSSQKGEEMSILKKPEAKSTKENSINNYQETRIEEESASEASKEKNSSQKDKKDEKGIQESEDEETKKREREETRENSKVEFVKALSENEMEEELEEDEYGDYDPYNGDNDWVNDISKPKSYWEDLRKERYLEVLNTEKKDICNLIERRTVYNFLTSDLRQKIDNLMVSRVQGHIGIPINPEDDEEEEGWVEACSTRSHDNETEKTNLEAVSDNCSQSSARSSTLMISWSFMDQDNDKDHEPTTSLSLPESSVPTNQSTQELQMINDLRVQMEQMQREMLELQNTVKSCIETQLHFQKSVTQSGNNSLLDSSGEERVETKKDPLNRKCCVCLEMPVDSLLYRCGHMCTCLKCAHELQWSSKKCPICMAPIVDVVRAILDS